MAVMTQITMTIMTMTGDNDDNDNDFVCFVDHQVYAVVIAVTKDSRILGSL